MDFAHFRTLANWTLEEAANRLKDGAEDFARVNASLVSKHERGLRFPSPELIERYSQITHGAVTFDDWHALRKANREAAQATA